jgi:hypothetical protein
MKTKSMLHVSVAAIAIAAWLGSAGHLAAQQGASPPAVAIDNDDIGGVVTGANGPEPGVWVIAETTDLPTRYAKMVVTDDQAATWCRIFPRPNTSCGCAATDSSIHPRSTASRARPST